MLAYYYRVGGGLPESRDLFKFSLFYCASYGFTGGLDYYMKHDKVVLIVHVILLKDELKATWRPAPIIRPINDFWKILALV